MSFNDPQWGRSAGSDKPRNDEQENQQRQDQNQPDPNDENRRREEADRQASDNDRNNMSDRRGSRNEGNDLDQLWNDFNRMVNSILGGGRDAGGIACQPAAVDQPYGHGIGAGSHAVGIAG